MGGASAKVLECLREYESPNILFREEDGSWPIVWESARGCRVRDAEGREYLDLTAAFGVASAGHANPRVVAAGARQMRRLLHAMGDVHPHAKKAELARRLSQITFERWSCGKAKTIFTNSGFEAVESALKTALLATGRRKVLAFAGGYHGLGYGALNATHREHFRLPFESQLGRFAVFETFPRDAAEIPKLKKRIAALLERGEIGAAIVEPVQVRGGINVPPPDFLPALRELCDEAGALLIFDEVYTGFGRTGKWFACEHWKTAPDLVCLGKALTGGFPLSACVGRAKVIDEAWPRSTGEAIHTSTFLGHPVGCAMALAQIDEIERRKLPERASALGEFLMKELELRIQHETLRVGVRGLGLLAGIEVRGTDGSPATKFVWKVIREMLRRGFILLPEGADGNVISLSPPLTISRREISECVSVLGELLRKTRGG
jgi:4-aminobutyrate aminotransferase-like enzyme